MIFNWSPIGIDGCLVDYDVANDALHMSDLTGSLTTYGSMSLLSPSGALGDFINSNCKILGPGSSIAKTGNTIAIALNTSFKPSTGDPVQNGDPGFIGQQNIYMRVDLTAPGTFQAIGTWTPVPVPYPGYFSSSVVPTALNPDQTLTFGLYNGNGFRYSVYSDIVIGTSLTDTNACRIRYNLGTGQFNHILNVLNSGNVVYDPQGIIGGSYVGYPPAVVADTSCLLDISRSYVGQESGTGSLINLYLKFLPGYGGAVNVYQRTYDRQNAAGAWTTSQITLPTNDFSLDTIAPQTIQSGTATSAFSLGVSTTGSYSGNLTLGCLPSCTVASGPLTGVSVAFQNSTLNTMTIPRSVTTTLTIPASATPGTATIVLTATDASGLRRSVNLTVTIAPYDFKLNTPSAISVPVGGQTSFSLGVTTSGAYQGTLSFSCQPGCVYTSGPLTGASVTFQPSTLNTATGNAVNVTVKVDSSGSVGTYFFTIKATDTLGVVRTVDVPISITAAGSTGGTSTTTSPAPPPSISITGDQTQYISGPLNVPQSFTVAVSGVSWDPARQVSIVTDALATDYDVSVMLNPQVAVSVPGQFTVSLTPVMFQIGYASSQFCAVVYAVYASSLQSNKSRLCVVYQGTTVTSSVSLSLPPSATTTNGTAVISAVVVPQGGYNPANAVITDGGATCAAGVTCNATATFGAISGNSLTITFNANAVTQSYTQYININGVGQSIPITVVGDSVPVNPANLSADTNTPSIYNDNNTNPTPKIYPFIYGDTQYLISCDTIPNNPNISVGIASRSGACKANNSLQCAVGLTYRAVAGTTSGNYNIQCVYNNSIDRALGTKCTTSIDGTGHLCIPVGLVTVYDTSPVITSISPPSVQAGANAIISINGRGFGSNPTVTIGGQTVSGYVSNANAPGNQVISGLSFTAPTGVPSVGVTVARNGTGGLAFLQNPLPGNPQTATAQVQVQSAPAFTMDSLQLTQPATANAVDGTSPTVTPVTSTNISSSFAIAASTDLVTVLKNSGTVTVTAINIQPAVNANQVLWSMQRDPTDTVDTAVPGVSGAPGNSVNFPPSSAGNFRLVAYTDTNSNGQFDEGEQLRILRFAVVQATLQPGSAFAITDTVAAQGAFGVRTLGINDPAMALVAEYLLEGGGLSRNIGTQAIGIGNIGNLVNDTFAVSYPVPTPVPAAPGNAAGTGNEIPGNCGSPQQVVVCPTPMIDTSNVAEGSQPTGSATTFRGGSQLSSDLNPPTTGGRLTQVSSSDGPEFSWANLHPTTSNPWSTTTGGVTFREFIVAYSNSFPQTYLSLNQAQWAINIIGQNSGTQWMNINVGASVTGDSGLQPVGATKVQVRGRSYVKEVLVGYNP